MRWQKKKKKYFGGKRHQLWRKKIKFWRKNWGNFRRKSENNNNCSSYITSKVVDSKDEENDIINEISFSSTKINKNLLKIETEKSFFDSITPKHLNKKERSNSQIKKYSAFKDSYYKIDLSKIRYFNYDFNMKKFKISNDEVAELSNAPQYEFPKYVTQVINLVNSNAGGTRPKVVGQMSELVKEFDGKTIDEWIAWYTERYPDAINDATNKIWNMYETMKNAFNAITKEMVENWVKDLVYGKTYCGLKFQTAIISAIASQLNKDWREANPEEEAQGIDGFIGDKPLQIKSATYKLEARLSETIDVPIVYYDKKKDGINIEYNPKDF